jgi:hypothetical protein
MTDHPGGKCEQNSGNGKWNREQKQAGDQEKVIRQRNSRPTTIAVEPGCLIRALYVFAP